MSTPGVSVQTLGICTQRYVNRNRICRNSLAASRVPRFSDHQFQFMLSSRVWGVSNLTESSVSFRAVGCVLGPGTDVATALYAAASFILHAQVAILDYRIRVQRDLFWSVRV